MALFLLCYGGDPQDRATDCLCSYSEIETIQVLDEVQGMKAAGTVKHFAYDSDMEQTQLLTAILANKLKVRAG